MNPLKESIDIIKKRNKTKYFILVIIFILLFIQSFFAGQYLYKTDKAKAEDLVKQIGESKKTKIIIDAFRNHNYVLAASLIFINNFLINIVSMYLGVIVIVPLFIFLSNALSLGILFGIDSLVPPAPTLQHVIFICIVGILEIFCFILITYEGLNIASKAIKSIKNKKKNKYKELKQSFREATKILPLIALILILAALVETIGIAIFSSKFVS
ncbi:stage II sporulation protein M [Candidatus Pacearchaeota archaeon]|nr:stage II sporulation protein M [Candidatus Pacearchaeota archaeon]